MIIEQQINDSLVRHYSDAGMMIRQVETDVLYSDAVDVIPCRYTYQETTTPVEHLYADEVGIKILSTQGTEPSGGKQSITQLM